MSKTGDMPAFPLPDTHHPSGLVQWGAPGLTKREYIAIHAMQGMCARALTGSPEERSKAAFALADAMLEESEKGTPQ